MHSFGGMRLHDGRMPPAVIGKISETKIATDVKEEKPSKQNHQAS
jgi:hypothetical protein